MNYLAKPCTKWETKRKRKEFVSICLNEVYKTYYCKLCCWIASDQILLILIGRTFSIKLLEKSFVWNIKTNKIRTSKQKKREERERNKGEKDVASPCRSSYECVNLFSFKTNFLEVHSFWIYVYLLMLIFVVSFLWARCCFLYLLYRDIKWIRLKENNVQNTTTQAENAKL